MIYKRRLEEMKEMSGLTSDQLTYVITLFCLFWISHIFRVFLSPQRVSAQKRHFISLTLGAGMLSLVFGKQALHLLFSSLIAYVLMLSVKAKVVHIYVMMSAMMYLSFIHIWRMFLHDDTYVIDISAPLMMATIKITYVGFGIHDSKIPNEDFTENNIILKKKPTLLEYLGYIFNFSSVFCGPPPEYQDYMDFIEGSQFDECKEQFKEKTPSPMGPSLKKFILGYIAVGVYGLISSSYNPDMYKTGLLEERSFLFKVFFAEMMIYHHKFKYYCAFGIGESICNASGLGFNGVDKANKPRWDGLKTIKPLQIEYARNIREYVDCWNLTTNKWLKKCIYSRMKMAPYFWTFFFSALWHGFYSGYYTFFLPVGYTLFLTKKMRRIIRPYFLTSFYLKFLYDIMTWLVTRLLLSFYSVGFATLNLATTFKFWRSANFYGHYILILGTILVGVLSIDLNQPSTKERDQNGNSVLQTRVNNINNQLKRNDIINSGSFKEKTQ